MVNSGKAVEAQITENVDTSAGRDDLLNEVGENISIFDQVSLIKNKVNLPFIQQKNTIVN